MNITLGIAIVLQILLALSTEGLPRAMAELTAFILTFVLFANIKRRTSAQAASVPLTQKVKPTPSSANPTKSSKSIATE